MEDTAAPERPRLRPQFLQKISTKHKRLMMRHFYTAREFILPLIFPRRCPFCQRVLPYSNYLCTSCQQMLPLIHSPTCFRCGKPLNHQRQELCYDCRIFPKSFEEGLALFLYNSMTKNATTAFKYHNQRYLADFFTHAILRMHLAKIKSWNLQAIIPIPIHKNKRKKRGYNQAELLAKQLSDYLEIPCYSHYILRTIDTLPQKQFSPQARLNNLQKAFQINPRYLSPNTLNNPPHSVLLIDDIYTTGATMESCTRLLHAAGVEKVYIYSLCIGVARDEIM